MNDIPGYLKGVFEDANSYVREVFKGELQAPSYKAISALRIPTQSKEFLADVGLPHGNRILEGQFTWTFGAVGDHLRSLSDFANEAGIRLIGGCTDFICVDFHQRYKRATCIDPTRDGAVYDIAIKKNRTRR